MSGSPSPQGIIHIHSVAKRWFDNAADRMVFCRVTELGLFKC